MSRLDRRVLKATLTLFGFGAGLYLPLLAALFFLQTRLIFPGAAPAPALPSGAQHLALEVGNGELLRGVHIPPRLVQQSDGTLLIGFGGNAWNAEAAAAMLHELYPRSDIVAFHFRGYPPSSGKPGATALLADAPLIFDHVVKHFPGRKIVAAGFSIGTAAAARLTTDPRLAGAILVTPFDSLKRLAQWQYRWAPVGLLLRHRLDPVEDVRRAKSPVAVIAAEQDEIVPSWSSAALKDGVAELAFERVIAGVDHNSIYQSPAFGEAMREALRAIIADTSKA